MAAGACDAAGSLCEDSVKRGLVVTVAVLAGFVVCGATWFSLPLLQDRRQSAADDVSTRLERARRLLYKYDPGLTRKSLLLERLSHTGVDVDVEDPAALADAAADEYQAIHERLWDSFQPVDLRNGRASNAKASYGNLEGQIRKGIRARKDQVAENDRWLDKALAAVDKALAATDRDVPPATYAEAHRLKGVILYGMGIARWLGAQAKRREAQPLREQLRSLAVTVADLKAATSTFADREIEQRIEELEARAERADEALQNDRHELDGLDTVIADLESRLVQATSRRNLARDAMDEMLDRGIDFSNADGAAALRSELLEQNGRFREAEREVAVLMSGSYTSAKLDRPGDYLAGHYVEDGSPDNLSVEYGLLHYRDARAALNARIQVQTTALETLKSEELERLNEMKETFQQDQDRATDRVADAMAKAGETYDELNRAESEAFALEEQALARLEDSAVACQRAADAERSWVEDARDRTRGVSSDAKQRSAFAKRLNDEWMTGHIQAQAADARLAKAWIHYGRYTAYKQTADILKSVVGIIKLNEVDLEDLRTKVVAAHDAGVDEITKSLSVLEKAHRSAEHHWTITAEAAGAQYMYALFGQPSGLSNAVTAYRSAVKGREDQKFAGTFVRRLRHLEKR